MPASQPFVFTPPLIVAHRGYSGKYPENTMAAFKAATEAGAQMVELDVHLTRDNELVVIHDDTVDRTTDGKGPVDEYTLPELKKLDAGRWFHPRFTGEQIPTLKEVLYRLAPHVLINVEIKSAFEQNHRGPGVTAEMVLELLRRKDALATVLISSFDRRNIESIKRMDASLAVAFVSETIQGDEAVNICRELDAFSFHPDLQITDRNLVISMHTAGIQVFPWNVNSEKDFRRLVATGADGLITNEPALFKSWYSRQRTRR